MQVLQVRKKCRLLFDERAFDFDGHDLEFDEVLHCLAVWRHGYFCDRDLLPVEFIGLFQGVRIDLLDTHAVRSAVAFHRRFRDVHLGGEALSQRSRHCQHVTIDPQRESLRIFR